MKYRKPRNKILKFFRISLFVLCGLIIVAGSSLYLLLHSYISKVNLVSNSKQKQQNNVEAQVKSDDVEAIEDGIVTKEDDITPAEDGIVATEDGAAATEDSAAITVDGATISSDCTIAIEDGISATEDDVTSTEDSFISAEGSTVAIEETQGYDEGIENNKHDITAGNMYGETKQQDNESYSSDATVQAAQNTTNINNNSNLPSSNTNNINIPNTNLNNEFQDSNVNNKGLPDSNANNKGLPDSNANNNELPDSNTNNNGLPDSNVNNKGLQNVTTNNNGIEDTNVKNNVQKDSNVTNKEPPNSITNSENLQPKNTTNKGIQDSQEKNESLKNKSIKNKETSDAKKKDDKILESYQLEIKKNLGNDEKILVNKKLNNILIFGSYKNKDKNTRMNSMVLLSINLKTQKITATNFYENIYLMIPGKGYNQLKAAFAYDDGQLLIDTIETNFKISVDRYIQLDYDILTNLIDSIGGITVEIENEEIEELNSAIEKLNKLEGNKEKADLITEAGKIKLNGKQALAYSRSFFPGSESKESINRQVELLNILCKEFSTQDITQLNQLLNIVLPDITTNFSEGEILMQLLSVPSFLNYDITQLSIPIRNSYSTLRINDYKIMGIDFTKNIKELKRNLKQ